jgi:hypothetical protein
MLLAEATPTSPTTANVLVNAPITGTPVSYTVKVCLDSAPTNCKTLTCPTINCGPFQGLTPGASYTVSGACTLTDGTVVPASNTLPLVMPAASAPTLLTADPAGPDSGTAIALPPATGSCDSYKWTFTPLGGGPAVTATSAGADVTTASGSLAPKSAYEATVQCVNNGVAGPPSNAIEFVTPAPTAPLNDGEATSPTTADVAVTPPTSGGPWTSYKLTICPLQGPASKCQTVTCTTPAQCPVTGLDPETTYTTQTVAYDANNSPSAPSPYDTFTTPGDRPLVTDAQAYGPTTGMVEATAPPGLICDKASAGGVGARWAMCSPP